MSQVFSQHPFNNHPILSQVFPIQAPTSLQGEHASRILNCPNFDSVGLRKKKKKEIRKNASTK